MATHPLAAPRRARTGGGETGAGRRKFPLPLAALLALIPPALFLWFALFVSPTSAAGNVTFTVNSTSDEADASTADLVCKSTPSGVCTLRAAIEQASKPGGINPWTTATIVLPGGTYTLTKGQLNILATPSSVTIQGAGPTATIIDGNGQSPNCYPLGGLSCRIFDMKEKSTLIASGMTIRNGKAGLGALDHYHGGGIHNHGTLQLSNALVADNVVTANTWGGGGITNAGGATASLEHVTIARNKARANGGGIENFGGLSVITATISDNSAEGLGGGVWHSGSAFSAIKYATVAFNTAPGNAGGGGINRAGGTPLYVSNSVLTGNLVQGCAGALSSQGFNVSSDPSCTLNAATDKTTDPKIGGLQDNGGGLPTRRPGPTSPAIDIITSGCGGITDERGVARPQGAGCDAGAVEVRVFNIAITNSGGGTTAGGGQQREGFTASLTATPQAGQVFLGWKVDGVFRGWASPLFLTVTDRDIPVTATFVPRPTFPDLAGLDADTTEAIGQLAARGIIRGFVNAQGQTVFAPNERTRRAQMAALIARAMPAAPTDLLGVGQTWDNEDHGNNFSDRCVAGQGCIDDNLWRNVGTLQFRSVAGGYEASTCAAGGVAAPCYGPFDDVLFAQVISFITRSMVDKQYWQFATQDFGHYANVPGPFVPRQGHRVDLETFIAQAGGVPGSPDDTFIGYDQPSSRGWFALALWQALDSFWGVNR